MVKLIGSSLLEESREGDTEEDVDTEVVWRISSQDEDEEVGVLVDDEIRRLLNAGGPPSSVGSRGYPCG